MNATKKPDRCTAFRSSRQIAAGALSEVALMLRALAEDGHVHGVLSFDDLTGHQIDLDLSGTAEEVLQRLAPDSEETEGGEADQPDMGPCEDRTPAHVRAGRPRLGVVAREVTLLPRHWRWLSRQPGGASVALRKLVEAARLASADQETVRLAQEGAYKFMFAMAGNQPGFEEAARALFARNQPDFAASTQAWPADIRKFARRLAAPVWQIMLAPPAVWASLPVYGVMLGQFFADPWEPGELVIDCHQLFGPGGRLARGAYLRWSTALTDWCKWFFSKDNRPVYYKNEKNWSALLPFRGMPCWRIPRCIDCRGCHSFQFSITAGASVAGLINVFRRSRRSELRRHRRCPR